ncbi:thiamine pyrophosphokinase [Pedobacter sp. MC2016-14]|uniref:thiamine pyrophosphokinase n=1 Tax=Pedobacter sp. MC2016-14 TaxID=2897327 RepID=UPI001E446A63|nr:thiamine pyrophosphokinase [Pedobacter sp. MC2016-14]MCD0487405.1 thiamine pyrophosphokinase [Pedobacter sp. MC2016-14]
MSSHHIVREKQEPALYIHDLGAFDEEYLGQLLEWSPTLIVNSGAYEKIISLGLKVDVVLNPVDGKAFQENTKAIAGPGDDFNTVLNYLISEKYPAVNIIAKDKKLIDLDYYIPSINIVLFNELEKSYAIPNGFRVWKTEGSVFRIALNAYFETSNLKQNEQADFVVIKDGFVEFTFNVPYLLISELL